MLILQKNLELTSDIINTREKIKKIFRKEIQKLKKEGQKDLLITSEKEYSKALEKQLNPCSSADMNNPYIALYEIQIEVLKEELSKESENSV